MPKKKSFSYSGPTRPPGAMISQNSFLYYVRELISCKFQLFWSRGTWKEDFKESFSYVNTFKSNFPFCDPTRPLEVVILSNLRLYYYQKAFMQI
jgi:hypothetical protein